MTQAKRRKKKSASSGIASAALTHAKNYRGELQVIEVPEWEVENPENGELEPARIYFYENPTFDELARFSRFVDQKTGAVDVDIQRELLMSCALESDGRRIWGTGQRVDVGRLDPKLIIRIVSEMGIIDKLSEDYEADAKK